MSTKQLEKAVARFLGFPPRRKDWTPRDRAKIKEIVAKGIAAFNNPPPLRKE